MAEQFSKNYEGNNNETREKELQDIRNNYQYYSSKCSVINGNHNATSETKVLCSNFKNQIFEDTSPYLNMSLKPDHHFYHVSVNTSYTSVHIPTNVFDGSKFSSSIEYPKMIMSLDVCSNYSVSQKDLS